MNGPRCLRLQWFAWLLPGDLEEEKGRMIGGGGAEQNMPVAWRRRSKEREGKRQVWLRMGLAGFGGFALPPLNCGHGGETDGDGEEGRNGRSARWCWQWRRDRIWLSWFSEDEGAHEAHPSRTHFSPHTQRNSSRRLHTSVYPVLSPPSYHGPPSPELWFGEWRSAFCCCFGSFFPSDHELEVLVFLLPHNPIHPSAFRYVATSF